jgi:hypothetical protein
MEPIREVFRSLLARAKMAEHTFMVSVAIIIGVLAGGVALAFVKGLYKLEDLWDGLSI